MSDSPAALLIDASGNQVEVKAQDGVHRLGVTGKVSIIPPGLPAAATPVTISGDTPLSISTAQTAEYTIPNGKTFTLQTVASGAEGDPTAKGSKVEVIYYDGAAEHLVDRIYLVGETVEVSPNTSTARDGTSMAGDGSTKKVYLRRHRLSGAAQEVDAVARGYVQ